MSQSSIFGSVEIVKVQCVRCARIVRALAPAGVMGEADLVRIGWSANVQGKPVCDECTGGPAPILTPEQTARVNRLLGDRPVEASAAELDPGWVYCPYGCGVVVEEDQLCAACACCPGCCQCGQFVPRSDATAAGAATMAILQHFDQCPRCSAELDTIDNADGHCYSCGADLPNVSEAQAAYDLETVRRCRDLADRLVLAGRLARATARHLDDDLADVCLALAPADPEEL